MAASNELRHEVRPDVSAGTKDEHSHVCLLNRARRRCVTCHRSLSVRPRWQRNGTRESVLACLPRSSAPQPPPAARRSESIPPRDRHACWFATRPAKLVGVTLALDAGANAHLHLVPGDLAVLHLASDLWSSSWWLEVGRPWRIPHGAPTDPDIGRGGECRDGQRLHNYVHVRENFMWAKRSHPTRGLSTSVAR